MGANNIFERTEKKYVITVAQKNSLIQKIAEHIRDDEYGESTICSLYFDTEDFRMIRSSIEKPVYKEKLRLRSYSTPKMDSTVFLELKKKYMGVVYKRRETMKYEQALAYLNKGELPKNSQIMREIDWVMSSYPDLKPRMMICYDRTAYYSIEDSNLRITFDRNVRFRKSDLLLDHGSYGERILPENLCIMEIKALLAMPLWLCGALDELEIYPSSFSKYGTAYNTCLENKIIKNGGQNCA